MVKPGDRLPPNLELTVVHAGAVRTAPLGRLLTRRTIVSLYLRNNTAGCDRQNDELIAAAPALARAGFNLMAVSRDTPASHVRYAGRKGIPYLLVSDPGNSLARSADAIVEKMLYGRRYLGPARCALVLDRDGTVLAVAGKVEPHRHAEQLLMLVASLPEHRPASRKKEGGSAAPTAQ